MATGTPGTRTPVDTAPKRERRASALKQRMVAAAQTMALTDLSFDGMLDYERKIRYTSLLSASSTLVPKILVVFMLSK